MAAEGSRRKAEPRTPKSRSKPVKPGRLPVSEVATDRSGAPSPFGDDITFPLPADRLSYQHPQGA